MLNIFKKQKEKDISVTIQEYNDIFCPAEGEVIEMSRVEDPVFSSKLVGDGFAVEPVNGDVYSPVNGKVFSVFPTLHAITILSDDGLEILVHMGLDTVELEGKGFDIKVKEGDIINPGTLLAKMDLEYIQNQDKKTTIIVALTNLKDRVLNISESKHQSQDIVCIIK